MNRNDLMHRTHNIVMTHEQLRFIEHALRHADMNTFVPEPQDDIDEEGSSRSTLVSLAQETLEEQDSNMIHGWAV